MPVTNYESHAAAVFAAEQTVVEHLARAPRIRQRFTGRLLVPRAPGPLTPDGPGVKVIGWSDLLSAVSDEDSELPMTAEEPPWPRSSTLCRARCRKKATLAPGAAPGKPPSTVSWPPTRSSWPRQPAPTSKE